MADFENATAFAHYAEFAVGQDSVNPEEDGYPLTLEKYSGTAGKILLLHYCKTTQHRLLRLFDVLVR